MTPERSGAARCARSASSGSSSVRPGDHPGDVEVTGEDRHETVDVVAHWLAIRTVQDDLGLSGRHGRLGAFERPVDAQDAYADGALGVVR